MKLIFFIFIFIPIICSANDFPNFILLLTDDQSWNSTSLQMDPSREDSRSYYYQTPNIDKLAKRGIIFSRGYAPASKCAPTRAAILTGEFPASNFITNATTDTETGRILTEATSLVDLPHNDITIAELLKNIHSANYVTAHFGKWHLRGNGPQATVNL